MILVGVREHCQLHAVDFLWRFGEVFFGHSRFVLPITAGSGWQRAGVNRLDISSYPEECQHDEPAR
jgi:hypothetical protein